MPEDIEGDIQKMNTGGLYGNRETEPLLLQDLVEFFCDNYTEHAAIKQVVDVAASMPGIDTLVAKISHKPKITSTELASAFHDNLHRKLDYPIKERKYSEGLSRMLRVASTHIATFLAQGHNFTKRAFLKEMGLPAIIETVP
jgi:hypothetical protein